MHPNQEKVLKAIPNIKWYPFYTSYRLDLETFSAHQYTHYIVFSNDGHIFFCDPTVSEITPEKAIQIIKLQNFK